MREGLVFSLVLAVVGITPGLFMIVAAYKEAVAQRAWVPTRAVVLEVHHDRDAEGYGSLWARAWLRAPDGGGLVGWTQGTYGWGTDRYLGCEVDAWCDPVEPLNFTLRRPSVLGTVGQPIFFTACWALLTGTLVAGFWWFG